MTAPQCGQERFMAIRRERTALLAQTFAAIRFELSRNTKLTRAAYVIALV